MQILLGLILSLLTSGAASVVYVWLVWWLDHYEKEPWWMLALVFLWGALPAVLIAGVVELVLDLPISVLGEGLAYQFAGASVAAPVVEELSKGVIVLAVWLLAPAEFDGVLDGIVYGAMAGLGFAFTENIFYFVGSLSEGGWGVWTMVVLLRAVLFGLNHAFFTGLTGAAIGYARQSRRGSRGRRLLPLLGLGGAILATVSTIWALPWPTSAVRACSSAWSLIGEAC